MKRSNQTLLALLLVLLFCLQGCIVLPSNETTAPPQQLRPQDPNDPVWNAYQKVTYSYRAEVNTTVLTTNLNAKYLTLVNKEMPLGKDYIPASLVSLTCPTNEGKSVELDDRAAQALYELFSEMEAHGITDVFVTSGYRSYLYQKSLQNQYITNEQSTLSAEAYEVLGEEHIKAYYLDKGKTGLSLEDAQKVVRSYAAEPGYSEHQTGLCVDLITKGMNNSLTNAFEKTEAFAFLKDNAHKFGFILRYPKDKTDITGYTYESWHYRFVGREAATNIYLSDLTLEEYLALCRVD